MSKIKHTFITGETSVVIEFNGVKYPASLTLSSADVTRKVELSTNDGLEYFDAQVDITTATMLEVDIKSPVTNARLTGVVGDIVTVAY
jgi:hypothetical protein